MSETLRNLVAGAREACGCVGCVGGYMIGGNTLAQPDRVRPTTCVAAAILRSSCDAINKVVTRG